MSQDEFRQKAMQIIMCIKYHYKLSKCRMNELRRYNLSVDSLPAGRVGIIGGIQL